MSKSKMLRLIITTPFIAGENEVLAVLVKERHPNKFGEVTPPVMVEHEGAEYILKREWMQDIYVYAPADRRKVSDLLVEQD
jgi:hypothetical protein